MSEITERLRELEKKIHHDHKRLIVLRRFADLPGEYLAVLVERGLLADSTNLRLRHWIELADALKDLHSVLRFLRCCQEDILRVCGSVSSSWEVMSGRWNRLIQEVESFKNAREGCLQIQERIRAVSEKLPENFAGMVEDLAASNPTETLVLERDSKKVREAVEKTQAAIEKLEGELGEMENERENLVRRLRDDRHQG